MKSNFMRTLLALFFLGLSFCLDIDSSVWTNEKYSRSIDLTNSFVKEICLLEVSNSGDRPESEYYFAINDGAGLIPRISVMSIELGDVSTDLKPIKVDQGIYKVVLPAPISPKSTVQLNVIYVYTNTLTPFPEKLELPEAQTLLLKMNKLAYSPYVTKSYSLNLIGVSKIEEIDPNLGEGVQVSKNAPQLEAQASGLSVTFGPTTDAIAPYTLAPTRILYEHNRPLVRVAELERSIWLPATDVEKVSFEEYYEVINKAAKLPHGFLRAEWMKNRLDGKRNHWSLSFLQFAFTPDNQFDDYYYTDHVGVVSTHKFQGPNLLIKPRYPLFGGWKYNFTLGWTSAVQNYIHRAKIDKNTYVVKFPILNTLVDVSYDKVYLNFYLPEYSEFVSFSSPVDHSELKVSNEISYLDVSKGHVKVSVEFEDVVDDLSKLDAFVVFKYKKSFFWWKLAKLSGSVFLLSVLYYVICQIDISIGRKSQ